MATPDRPLVHSKYADERTPESGASTVGSSSALFLKRLRPPGPTTQHIRSLDELTSATLHARPAQTEGCDGLSPSTQILIKNTFIQFEEAAADSNNRPRGDSCDAVLFSSTPARCKALDALICIPENASTARDTDEDVTDHDSGGDSVSEKKARSEYREEDPSCDGCNQRLTQHLCENSDGDTRAGSTSKASAASSHQSMSPAELLESLVGCEQLKRMPLEDLPAPPHDKTTIMLRNIPNKYTQSMLLEAVDQEFRGLYDFFYLPIDFKNKCNVGYAFINFIHPYYAEMFSKKFAGLKLTAFKSKKICEVSWGRVQGLRQNIEHYRNSAIMSIPNSQYKPLIFKDGIPLQFPGPAGPVPAVKPRHGRAAAAT